MRLLERVLIKGRIDSVRGVIHRVKILGKFSQNGREYSDVAMDQAASLYEGMRVNLNHKKKRDQKEDRGMEDLFGVLRNVKRNGDSVYGDLHVLKTHPHAPKILEAAEKMPEEFGLSHDASGQVRRNGNTVIVDRLDEVHSVDLVQDPATTAGLFESQQKERNSDEMRTSVRRMRRLLEAVKEGLSADNLAEQLQMVLDDAALDDTAKIGVISEMLVAATSADDDAEEEPDSSVSDEQFGESLDRQRSRKREREFRESMRGVKYDCNDSQSLARELLHG